MRTANTPAAVMLVLLVATGCSKLASLTGGGGDASASGSAAATGPSSASTAPATAGAAAGAAGSAPTVAGFTGDVEMKMTAPQIPQGMDITYEIKGDKIRFDIPSFAPGMPAMWALEDRTANKLYMVMDAQKTIMVTDQGAAAKAHAAAAPPSDYKIDKTGKLDTVAGQSCEIWNVTSQGKAVQLCVIKGVQMLPTGHLAKTPGADFGWSVGLESEGVFPLRAIVNQNGAEAMRMEVVKFEKKPIDDSRFALPTGYRQIDQGAMPTGIPGMPGLH